MPYPLTPEEIASIRPRVEQFKVDKFDVLLSIIINNRAISLSIVEFADRERLCSILLPIIHEKIDDTILEIIFHENPLYYHNVQVNKPSQLLYRAEDTLKRVIRELIEEAYDDDISSDVRRKKVVGCINAVCFLVNREDFYRMLSQKQISVRRKRRK